MNYMPRPIIYPGMLYLHCKSTASLPWRETCTKFLFRIDAKIVSRQLDASLTGSIRASYPIVSSWRSIQSLLAQISALPSKTQLLLPASCWSLSVHAGRPCGKPGAGPRIDNPNDWVRAEIELAIEHNVPIIPILVQEATMPAADDLPATLTSLAYRNAVKVRPNPDFQNDMIRVMKGIESIDSAIIFSQQTGKANEQEEKKKSSQSRNSRRFQKGEYLNMASIIQGL